MLSPMRLVIYSLSESVSSESELSDSSLSSDSDESSDVSRSDESELLIGEYCGLLLDASSSDSL